MLERIEHFNGVVTYRSPLLRDLGVPHGFSTRIGGLSEGAYATLNLGSLAKGDATDANALVAENFRRLRDALQLQRKMRVAVRQVHGASVWQPPVTPMRFDDCPQADALVTDQAIHMLTIRTADCVPVLLASPDGRCVGAVHAGWRGVVANVVPTAVVKLSQVADISPRDLTAAIGPAISLQHFEIGPEVVEAFENAQLAGCVTTDGFPKPHIDLQRAVRTQLLNMDLDDTRIDGNALCTFEMEDEFFSYRRDGDPTGRMAAVIAVGSSS